MAPHDHLQPQLIIGCKEGHRKPAFPCRRRTWPGLLPTHRGRARLSALTWLILPGDCRGPTRRRGVIWRARLQLTMTRRVRRLSAIWRRLRGSSWWWRRPGLQPVVATTREEPPLLLDSTAILPGPPGRRPPGDARRPGSGDGGRCPPGRSAAGGGEAAGGRGQPGGAHHPGRDAGTGLPGGGVPDPRLSWSAPERAGRTSCGTGLTQARQTRGTGRSWPATGSGP